MLPQRLVRLQFLDIGTAQDFQSYTMASQYLRRVQHETDTRFNITYTSINLYMRLVQVENLRNFSLLEKLDHPQPYKS